jgi:signal-transduction protein with cAMP-binding, CBS, and nucleotidyltransferase domain
MTRDIRKQVIGYTDPLKMFLEMRLNQVDFFKDLSKHIKCEIMYKMTEKSFEAGEYIYKNKSESKNMYIILSG